MRWFTSTDSDWIYWDSNGNGGVTTNSPEGKFHIYTGSAGSVTALTSANELVLEGSSDVGMSILSPDANSSSIYFGSPSDNDAAHIAWNESSDIFEVETENSGSSLKLGAADQIQMETNSTQALVLYSNQNAEFSGNVGIGIQTGDGSLHVHTATAGSVTAFANADDVIVENSTHAGITILTPDADNSTVAFGSPSSSYASYIDWGYDDDLMRIRSGGDMKLYTLHPSEGFSTAIEIDQSQDVTFWGHVNIKPALKTYYGSSNKASITYTATNVFEFDSQESGSADFSFKNGDVILDTGDVKVPTGKGFYVNSIQVLTDQQAGANQAALTNSTGGSYDGTLAAISGSGDDTNINNNFTDLHTLLDEIRTALVTHGMIKGSA